MEIPRGISPDKVKTVIKQSPYVGGSPFVQGYLSREAILAMPTPQRRYLFGELGVGVRGANILLKGISPLYMNKETVYTDEYFEQNHLKRLNSWYGPVVKQYYRVN